LFLDVFGIAWLFGIACLGGLLLWYVLVCRPNRIVCVFFAADRAHIVIELLGEVGLLFAWLATATLVAALSVQVLLGA